jgi:hypothetical protein
LRIRRSTCFLSDEFVGKDSSVMEAKPLPKTDNVSEPADPVEQQNNKSNVKTNLKNGSHVTGAV